MHVLFADAIDSTAVEHLRTAGHSVDQKDGLAAADLVGGLEGVDALVVRSTEVRREAIESTKRLSLIVRAGAGVENIDMEAASARGVHVCNVPGRNAVAVAELTMGLLLAVDRHIAAATGDLKRGTWNKAAYSEADGLMGRTMGIIGLGEIGTRVAELAKAFGMTVVGLRREGRSADAEARIRSIGIRLVDSLESLVAGADVVSVHVPAANGEPPVIGSELLAQFRPGMVLLNTSRGDVVDEEALLAVLDHGGVRAGLDVYGHEPRSANGVFESKLARHPNVVGTHHIGASTAQAQRSIAAGVVEAIVGFDRGAPVNCVNLIPPGTSGCRIAIRHVDRVGVLAAVFAVLRGGRLNVQNMENRVFSGRTAAMASIEVGGDLTAEVVEQLEALPDVFGVSVSRAGGK